MSEKEIKFKYIFPEDYNPVYCNGAFGGISPQGEIIANFFLERMPVPNSVTNTFNPDGSLGGVSAVEPFDLDSSFVRFVSTGVVFNEATAKSIYAWLGAQIAELENRKTISVSEKEGE